MGECGTCRFYNGVRNLEEAEQARRVGVILRGSCFRFPTAVPNKTPTDWCGEFLQAEPAAETASEPKKDPKA